MNTIVQLAPAFSVALAHVPDLLNFAGAGGYDMFVAAAVPLLDTVIVCAVLVWPTVMLPKDSEVADVLTLGPAAAPPVPDRLTVMLVPPLPVISMLPP